MSPLTRGVYKDFVSSLRARETSGHTLPALCAFVDERLRELPAPLHWRVHLELADLSKREQRFAQARRLYGAATRLQPSAPQPWLEHAKMEEERGHFERCQRILRQGLRHCAHNEALLLKAIKLHERRGDLPAARRLLARLAPVAVERAWRALLEGALLEARTANVRTARRVFKFLLHHAAWCGPVWHEACRFEQRNECDGRALRLAERGLSQLPRYGPLWFVALRLLECVLPPAELLARARALVARGASTISKDLVWKLWLEYARIEDRRGSLRGAREAFAAAVLACPPNLRWKVWLGGARTELAHARADVAAALLERAMAEAPQKVRGSVRLERARLAEVTGRLPAARAELRAARRECPHEWKVFLEAVLLEVRARRPRRALRAARRALRAHAGTGRLWAVLIQLRPSLPPPREGEGGDEADDDDDERRGVGGGVGGHGDGGGGADDEAAAVGSQRLLRVFREALQQVSGAARRDATRRAPTARASRACSERARAPRKSSPRFARRLGFAPPTWRRASRRVARALAAGAQVW
jgi:la-related protein 1